MSFIRPATRCLDQKDWSCCPGFLEIIYICALSVPNPIYNKDRLSINGFVVSKKDEILFLSMIT